GRETDLHAKAVAVLPRAEVVGDPEPRVAPRPIGDGQVGEGIDREVRVVSKVLERVEKGRGPHDRGDLASYLQDVGKAIAKARREVGRQHQGTRASRWTFSCSRRIPYMSISGRGGQPGT